MKTTGRTTAMAVSLLGVFLVSGVFLAPDAFAQGRGRGVIMPHNPTGLRGAGGGQFGSHSGGQGLNAVGSLLGSVGGGYYGHASHHDRYSYAEAYRDVGFANTAVGLVGTLVNGYSYPVYPTAVASPYAVVPVVTVPQRYPVEVVPSPRVIVGSYPYYPYGYAPSPYPYGYCGYGTSYYNPPTVWNTPSPYAYGYYGYGKSYRTPPTVWNGPPARGYFPEHRGYPHHDGNHLQSGTWQNHPAGTRMPTYQGQSAQSPRSDYRGGTSPNVSGSRGANRAPQQSAVHASGQSHRIR